ncbi:unnamed protein product [Rotaria sp. Silwood2]|nr:unnamed protein product [Rotaria sp. Silwood2]
MSDENTSKSPTTTVTSDMQQNALFSRGDHFYWKCEYEKAKTHFQTILLQPSISLLDSARCYSSLGAANTKLQKYEEALDNYHKQLDILKQLKVPNKGEGDIAKCFMSIGMIYWLQRNYAQALEYQEKALKILSTITPIHDLTSKVYKNIANSYVKTKEFNSAFMYFEKALEIDHQNPKVDHLEFGQTYADIGAMFYLKQDYKQALNYFVKAREILLKSLEPSHTNIKSLDKTITTVQSKIGMHMSRSTAFGNEK